MTLAGIGLLIGGGVLSAVTMEDREPVTKMATVVGGANIASDRDRDGNLDAVYTVEVSEPGALSEPFTVESDRRLRINERVFVNVDRGDGSAELAGALDDGRFAAAIVVWILGVGLLVSARRRHVWTTRCRQLAALTVELDSSSPRPEIHVST